MTAGRLLLFLIVIGAAVWLFQSSLVGPATPAAKPSAPLERARSAARRSQARNGQTAAAAGDLDSAAPAGGVTENMTPEQVRSLLGPPDEVSSEESSSFGNPRERWTYRKAGKSVVFENGVAVRIE
jgi:hypothetical protein